MSQLHIHDIRQKQKSGLSKHDQQGKDYPMANFLSKSYGYYHWSIVYTEISVKKYMVFTARDLRINSFISWSHKQQEILHILHLIYFSSIVCKQKIPKSNVRIFCKNETDIGSIVLLHFLENPICPCLFPLSTPTVM